MTRTTVARILDTPPRGIPRFRPVIVVVGGLLASPAIALGQAPKDWLLSGQDADRYQLVRDTDVARTGEASKRVAARGNRKNDEWAVSVQMIDATPYRGGHIRLVGYVRTEDVGSAGLWMRVDGIIDGKAAMIGLDNSEDRMLEGTNDWTRREIVLEVPAESVTILLGTMIVGDGTMWVDDMSVEAVPTDVEITAESARVVTEEEYRRPMGVFPHPSNLGFEEAEPG